MQKCTACQQTNQDHAERCSRCDTPFRVSRGGSSFRDELEEKRYLTVLFCDLVGSTSLSEKLGAEGYREVLRVVHESSAAIIERHGGHVSQYLGDGILALFGYPVAYEDHAARAVSAAIEMQAAIPGYPSRIGRRVPGIRIELHSRASVHTGEVVLGETGTGPNRREVALGDAVNVASRLQALARRDSLLLTAATRRLLDDRFELEDAGFKKLRGLRDTVESFRVVRERPGWETIDAAQRGNLTPMVGRDEELALLGGRWRKVIEGEGQIVVVSGDAGIGKSRLIEALRRDLDVGSHWFDVRGSSYHKSSELHPVIELVEHRGLEGTTGAAAEARLSRLVSIMGLDEEESLSVLAPLFSLPDVPPSLLLPAEQRLRILGILGSALWHLAESSPTVVALEDLQWLDPTTIEALRTLVPLVGTRRVLLVMTCRSEFEVPWSYQPNELRLSLDRLDVDRSQELVESVASNRALPDAVIREVLAKSDGVPLFLEEVARMLVEEPGAIETVPERLEGLLAAKLDRLPAHVLETARVGAVIGRHVPREVLREVSPKGPQAIDMDATALIEAGVFLPDDGGYVFKHVLLRDAAYERMLRSTREDIHRRVATVLRARFPHLSDTQPELVAHHFTQAGASTEAQVAWTQAGARSLRNGAYVEAVYHFRSALEQLERSASAFGSQDVQEELRLRKDLGVCLIATQGYTSDAVAENYRLALQRSAALHDRQEEMPIHVLYGLWGTCLVGGDREATDELAKHFERVERSTDPLARHVAHSTLGARAFYRGDYAEALTRCQEAMRLYEPANHFVLLRDYGYEGGLYSYQYVAYTLCFTGFPDQGLEYAKQGLRLADSIGDPYARAVALSGVACVARERREREPALASAAGLLELAQQRQFVMWVGIAHCLHGWARLDVDPAGGADEIRDGLRIWAATGARVPGTYLRLSLIEAELALGRVDAGLEAVEDGLRQCRATLESYLEPEYHRLQGELLRLKDDDKAAEREIRRALREAAGQGAAWIELRAALSLARLAAASGGPPDALGRLSDVRARLTEGADTPDMREATALLAAAV